MNSINTYDYRVKKYIISIAWNDIVFIVYGFLE